MYRGLLSPERIRRERRRKWILTAIALAVIILLTVFVVYSTQKYKEKKYFDFFSQPAVTVGSYTTDFATYRYFYLNYRDKMKSEYKDEKGKIDTAALDTAVRRRVGEALCGQAALFSLAAEYGITPDSAEIKVAATEFVDAQRLYYNGEPDAETGEVEEDLYTEKLEENYMTEAVVATLFCADEVERRLYAKMLEVGDRVETDDDRIAEILRSGEFACAKVVFIRNDKDDDVDFNRALAEKVILEYESGTPFDTLVTLYSENRTMPSAGYYFTRGSMEAVFDNVFALDEGDISRVIETEEGYYVFLRLEKDEQYLTENYADLKEQYQQTHFYEWIAERAALLYAKETDYVRSLSYKEMR